MTVNGWLQILLFLAVILAVTKPLGIFMTRVFNREKTFLDPVLCPVERLLYRVTGVEENARDALDRVRRRHVAVQPGLHAGVVSDPAAARHICHSTRRIWRRDAEHLAFNTAASFTTNTNWQTYSVRRR